MHKMKINSLLVASLIAGAALLYALPNAYADRVDCGGVPHWNSDHRYKKGDRAWHHEGGNSYYLYKCDQAECVGAGSNEPSYGSKVWHFVGSCKETPH